MDPNAAQLFTSCELLHDNGVEYNTFSDKFSKKKAFIIRGMVNGHDEDNIACIQETLEEYQVSGILSITRFFAPHMKRNENSNVLYQLVLAAGSDECQLEKIKTIDNFRVKFEKMNTTKTAQCRRCQGFSHTASSCGYKYRCVQCTQSHGPGACPRKNNTKLPIGCVNCLTNNLPRGVNAKPSGATSTKNTQQNKPSSMKPKNQKKTNDDIKSGDFAQATLHDVTTPANGGSSSKRKTKRFINQYRPSATTASGSRNKNAGKSSKNSQSSGAGGCGPNDKKELFNLIGLLMNAIQKLI